MRLLIGSILTLLTFFSHAQMGNLKGKLTDEITGENLVGAYVRVVGTYGAAISEAD